MGLISGWKDIYRFAQIFPNIRRPSAPAVYNLGERFYLEELKPIPYKSGPLSHDDFLQLSSLSDTKHLRETFENILVPRVVGSEGHKNVRKYIVNSLRQLNWNIELNKFHDKVPILGKLHFQNIIATLNPNAERYLTLACHYDSKYMPDIKFVGATDSAMPCAILLNLAYVLQAQLNAYRETELSVMLLFFDGEEAFEKWGPHDSIYGARHLAKKWDADKLLDRLDMLVLLDLIGAPDPKFYSFFKNTENWYARLINIEERLSNAGLLERYANSGIARPNYPNRYFQLSSMSSSIVEDDHKPFFQRGVPVLHLIPLPFPDVWHTEDDNETIIDFATSENMARIIRIFTLEYLQNAPHKKVHKEI